MNWRATILLAVLLGSLEASARGQDNGGLSDPLAKLQQSTHAFPTDVLRPPFLPPPVPRAKPNLTPDNGPKLSPGQEPQTMVTEVELPLPQPVADQPNKTEPEATPPPNSPTIIFGNPGMSPSPSPTAPPPAVTEPTTPNAPEVGPTPVPTPTPADGYSLLKQGDIGGAGSVATATRDPDLARNIGWVLFNGHRYGDATKWFEQAISWNEQDYEAAYGLTLSLERQGNYGRAEEVARWRLDDYPGMRRVLGDIYMQKAVTAYKNNEFARSKEFFAQVLTFRELTRDERIVNAWNEFHLGELGAAAADFEKLYEENPDRYAAEGVYAAYAKLQNWNRLGELAKKYDGPLAGLYQHYVVERDYSRHLYASAYALDPNRYPELQNYTAPVVGADGYVRYKSGNSFSKLREYRADALASFYIGGINRFYFDGGWTELNNDGVPANAFVGQVPLVGPRTQFFHSPSTYSHLYDFRFGYQLLGTYSPYAEIGITPAEGAINPTIVGKLGLLSTLDWGNWDISFYRKSVKESLLSYTGMVDPYTGQKWGRVTETGFNLNALASISSDWAVYGATLLAIRDGENVETNDHFAVTVSLGRNIHHSGFSYLTIGPSLSYETYSKNLSNFTFGQGGYFSPQFFLQGNLAVQFMTAEGKTYLLRGSGSVGLQTYRQDSSPVFPLQNSSATFPQTDTQTFSASARVAGLILVTPQIAAGFNLQYDKTANYSEFSAQLLLKFFFEPRAGLFATDFFGM